MWRRKRFLKKRQAALQTTSHDALRALLKVRLPEPTTHWREVEFVAIDVETTGIDPTHDRLLSVGWVPILTGRVVPGLGGYSVVRSNTEVGQSATIHGLTDSDIQAGVGRATVFSDLANALRGKVAVMHHAPLDLAMLNRLSEDEAGAPLVVPVIDTLDMAKARQILSSTGPVSGALRLEAVRTQLGLPRYAAHHSQVDALATAEVFLALVQKRFGDGARLKDLWPC